MDIARQAQWQLALSTAAQAFGMQTLSEVDTLIEAVGELPTTGSARMYWAAFRAAAQTIIDARPAPDEWTREQMEAVPIAGHEDVYRAAHLQRYVPRLGGIEGLTGAAEAVGAAEQAEAALDARSQRLGRIEYVGD